MKKFRFITRIHNIMKYLMLNNLAQFICLWCYKYKLSSFINDKIGTTKAVVIMEHSWLYKISIPCFPLIASFAALFKSERACICIHM